MGMQRERKIRTALTRKVIVFKETFVAGEVGEEQRGSGKVINEEEEEETE